MRSNPLSVVVAMLLIACHPQPERAPAVDDPGTGAPEVTAGDVTAYTGGEHSPASEGPCAGHTPSLSMESAEEVMSALARTSPIVEFTTVHAIVMDGIQDIASSRRASCIEITTQELTGWTTYEGDCWDGLQRVFTGSVSVREEGDTVEWDYQDLVVNLEDWDFYGAVDGIWMQQDDGETTSLDAAIAVSYHFGDPTSRIAWEIEVSDVSGAEGAQREGWLKVSADPSESSFGEMCFDIDATRDEVCDDDDNDVRIHVQGAADWVLESEWSRECDDCMDVTRDGASIEAYCP